MTQTQFLETDAAFALHVKQLHDRLSNQMEVALDAFDVKIPGKTTSIVQLLFSVGPRSKADIARTLEYSHQLTTQRLAWLLEHEMAEMKPDPKDKRRQLARLTTTGIQQAQRLQDFLPLLAAAYADLFAELDVNLSTLVKRASKALDATSLTQRLERTDAPIAEKGAQP